MNFSAKFPSNERKFNVFNDENVMELNIRREHMMYMSCTAIFAASESMLQPEARRWTGERSIAQNRGKKKYRFIGREDEEMFFCKSILDGKNGTFNGLKHIPHGAPPNNIKLWPLKSMVKTIFA